MKKNYHLTKYLRRAEARLLFTLMLVLAAGSPNALWGQGLPERMNYQGLLLTGTGLPVTGPTDVEFRIWDSPTNLTGLKWGRTFRVTPDPNGVFNVVLSGDGTLLGDAPNVSLTNVFSATNTTPRYLELTVAGATAIRPRQQFLTAPYAFLANDVTAARQNFTVAGALTVGGAANLASATVSGLASAGSLNVSGAATAGSINVSGAATASSVTITGAVNAGSITVTGAVTAASGTITASNFVGYGTIPIGGIIMWSGYVTNLPAGWALCDGTTANGVVTPDLRGRFVLGYGSGAGLTPRTLEKQAGGAESVTLSTAQLPAHSHTIQVATVGYTSSYNSGQEATAAPNAARNNGTQYRNTWADGGGGQAFSIIPPYCVLAYIIRVR